MTDLLLGPPTAERCDTEARDNEREATCSERDDEVPAVLDLCVALHRRDPARRLYDRTALAVVHSDRPDRAHRSCDEQGKAGQAENPRQHRSVREVTTTTAPGLRFTRTL